MISKISEKQEALTESYLRKDDYHKYHDDLVRKVEELQKAFADRSREYQELRAEWRAALGEHIKESHAICERMDTDIEAIRKDVQDTRIRNLTTVIAMLVSAITGIGIVQFVHIITGK